MPKTKDICLISPEIRLSCNLSEKGYLCPVDNVIIDAPFCGYSPRMNGYIGRENFDRFKIQTEFVNPFFPFKSAEQIEENVTEWIEKNLLNQKAAGVFGIMNYKVLASKPIFDIGGTFSSTVVRRPGSI